MAEKFVPLATQNLSNQTSITQNIDSNFNAVSVLLNDVLSRGGVAPNQMAAPLDMNNNPIINLPIPNTLNSPARLADINSNVTPTPAVISGSNLYTGNNTFTGTTTISGTELITGKLQSKNGYPWVDVTAWGATGQNNSADTAAIQNAVNYACSIGNAIVFFPQGTYNINATITVATTGSGNIVFQGASQTATVFQTNGLDLTVFHCTAGTLELRDLQIIGKGINDTGSYGATQSLIVGGFVSCSNVRTNGGYRAIALQNCGDIILYNFYPTNCYGDCICYFKQAAGWWIRVKADQQFPVGASITNGSSFGNWVASTTYHVGDAVIVQPSGAVLQCVTAGTSSNQQPLPSNYFNVISEPNPSTVQWQLMAPSVNYTAIILDSVANQNYFFDIDMTGCFFKGMVLQDSASLGGPIQTVITNSNISPIETGIELAQGNGFTIENCNLQGSVPSIVGPGLGSLAIDLHSTYQGNLQVVGNTFFGGFAAGVNVATGVNAIISNNLMSVSSGTVVSIGSGVTQFIVKNNIMSTGGTTAIQLGGSNSYYVVSDNIVTGKQVTGATTSGNSFAGNNF